MSGLARLSLSPITTLHHSAHRCKDAHQTTHFYRDILGLELTAALAFDRLPGSQKPQEFMHLFFKMANGQFIAFFDSPYDATPEMFQPRHGFDLHLAFQVDDQKALTDWKHHLQQHIKVSGPIDHGFVHSIYGYDPNGIQIEFTCKDPKHDVILDHERQQAEHQLARWTEKTSVYKQQLFGQDALLDINK